MKLAKVFLAAVTFFVLAIGVAFYAKSSFFGNANCENGMASSAACGKCGDGYCNPRCGENERNCPKDCGVTATSK